MKFHVLVPQYKEPFEVIKNRMFGEGLMMESITFDDWIENIKKLED